jgi:hypothetical protein
MGLRVIHHTDSVLEIEDRPVALWAMGGVFALAGAAVFALGGFADGSLAAASAGLLFMGVGSGLVVGVAHRRHRLDQRAGTLTIEIRTQSAVTLEERSLGDVTDVVVEAMHSNRNGRSGTYRLAYVFADGARLPWTSYYSGTRRDKDACARLVREFLRLERRARAG